MAWGGAGRSRESRHRVLLRGEAGVLQGKEECRTVYESTFTTRYVEKQPGKFVADTNAYHCISEERRTKEERPCCLNLN